MFETIYDVRTDQFPWFINFGLPVLLAVVVVGLMWFRRSWWGLLGLFVPAVFFLNGLSALYEYRALRADAGVNGCRWIEGAADYTNYEHVSVKGPPETLKVGDETVSFSALDEDKPGYHKTVARGGPDLQGRRVRLCVIRGRIAILEVAR